MAVIVGKAFTTIVNVFVEAHCPEGENVYVFVIVLFNAGDQVPAIELVDTDGNGVSV